MWGDNDRPGLNMKQGVCELHIGRRALRAASTGEAKYRSDGERGV
jgi:hypothetical protein